MKNYNEILNNQRIKTIHRNYTSDDVIQIKCDMYSKVNHKLARVKFTKAVGWEHLSVAFDNETPSWDDMQSFKEDFWEDTEVCYQLHPAKDNYVDDDDHCLHIWRNITQEVLTPPVVLVGLRSNHLEEDKKALMEIQAKLGTPLSPEEVEGIVLLKKFIDYMKGAKNESF